MASTNKTVTLELSQFIATDKPSWLTDYNGDMEKIDNFAAGVDADISSAKSDAASAKSTAQTANNTAQQAQTSANQAQGTANTAQSTANTALTNAEQALQTANMLADGWKTATITNPDTTNMTLYYQACRYNKSAGLLYINASLSVSNKSIGENTVILNIPNVIAGANKEIISGLIRIHTNEDKTYNINGTIDTTGNILYGPQAANTTKITSISICACISMAGEGNGWVAIS